MVKSGCPVEFTMEGNFSISNSWIYADYTDDYLSGINQVFTSSEYLECCSDFSMAEVYIC